MKYTLMANMILSQFEGLKRILIIALDFDKTNISNRSTYGQILTAIKYTDLGDDVVNILNAELRNTLAHNSWYVENDQMKYIDDNNEERIIQYKELAQQEDNFTHFSNGFYKIYWHNHTPPGANEFGWQQYRKDNID